MRTRQRAGTYTEPAIPSARHNEQLADRARFSCKVQESLTFQVSTASLIIKDLLPADKPAASCLWQFPKGTQTTNSSTHLSKKQGLFQKGITTGETHSGKILLLFPQRPKNRLKSTHLPKWSPCNCQAQLRDSGAVWCQRATAAVKVLLPQDSPSKWRLVCWQGTLSRHASLRHHILNSQEKEENKVSQLYCCSGWKHVEHAANSMQLGAVPLRRSATVHNFRRHHR